MEQYKILIDKGYTTRQIAKELGISRSNVMRQLKKLGLKTIHNISPNIKVEQLQPLVNKGLSSYEIANELKINRPVAYYWIKKHKLKLNNKNNNIQEEIKSGFKTCPQCKKQLELSNYYIQKNGEIHSWCKKCNNEASYQKQKEVKRKAVEYKGGKCVVCGYDKHPAALDFHHIDPTTKEFTISEMKTYNWERIKNELDKCEILCRNCHAIQHAFRMI